jgi:hypothetical protein
VKPRGPRTLLVDIETFPLLMYCWQPWEASALKIVQDTSIASFSAKWLDGKMVTKCLADYKGYKAGSRDDRALLDDLWALLDEADIVIAHNLDRFDAKKITYRFMVHGMKPPAPYQASDTLKEVKKVASFDSHRLNELCRLRNIGQKVRTGGADLWFDCIAGDAKAWKRMKKYNAHDVRLLEGWYLDLLPWMKSHPNVGMWSDRACCPKCGSTRLQSRGIARNKTTAYTRYQCRYCGSWSRSAKNLKEHRAEVVL